MVRAAVIGVGNMGTAHATCLREGRIAGMTLSAVCDVDPQRLSYVEQRMPEVARFADWRALLASGAADAAIVAVPHRLHAQIGAAALEAGWHALVEKPIDVSVSRGRALCDAARRSGRVFALMLNQRTNPLFLRCREIVRGGQLGELKRSVWIVTNWYRTQHYYDSGAWRATWAGEGGGVLLNQAPHNLDLWQWICGMPEALTAYCDTARYHHIEVEDEATILTRYANGASGAFITSTGEYPGTNRLEISGTLGKVVLEGGKLCWWRLREPEDHVRFASPESFARIPADYEEILPEGEERAHADILQNFADAILHGAALISPGEDGLNELTLSNAAYLSQWQGNVRIGLPFDEAQFDRLLAEHAAASRFAQDGAQRKAPGGEADGRYSERWRVNW